MLRQLLDGEQDLLSSERAGLVLGELSAFASNVWSQGFHAAVRNLVPDFESFRSPVEIVNALAKALTRNFSSLEGDLFRKSIQEAILEAGGLRYELESLDLVSGLQRFLNRGGVAAFLERFLSLYVFDVVWFAIQDSARLRDQSEQSMMVSIPVLERLCGDIVRSVSIRLGLDQKADQLSSDRRIGETIIHTIKHRLLIHADDL